MHPEELSLTGLMLLALLAGFILGFALAAKCWHSMSATYRLYRHHLHYWKMYQPRRSPYLLALRDLWRGVDYINVNHLL